MSRSKEILNSIFALLIGIMISLIIGEFILRLIPTKYNMWKSRVNYTRDDSNLNKFTPNQKFVWNKACFQISPIHINSFGFRDIEWNFNGDIKIGILGDSFMEALQVSEDAHTSAILRRLFRINSSKSIEVFNAGVSGRGTIMELLHYKRYFKPLNMQIVILFFLTGNDLRDNHCELSRIVDHYIQKPCAYLQDGALNIDTDILKLNDKFKEDSENSSSKLTLKVEFLKKRILLYQVYKDLVSSFTTVLDNNKLPLDWYVYTPPVTTEWQEAWEITEQSLVMLKREIENDGGKFIVVTIPEHARMTRMINEEERKKGFSEFDVFYPVKRLKEFARTNNILFLELEPYFFEYRDKFNLEEPYFSFSCDGHWNPLGHFIASNLVAGYLVENNLVPFGESDKNILLGRIERNIRLSPVEILGENAFHQIYSKDVYKGEANISKILELN